MNFFPTSEKERFNSQCPLSTHNTHPNVHPGAPYPAARAPRRQDSTWWSWWLLGAPCEGGGRGLSVLRVP